jgi:hypothetical protein
MTKKFWADWQKRIGETKNIRLFYKSYNDDGTVYYHGNKTLLGVNDRLLKATFHKDTVDLVLERHASVFNKKTWNFCQHVEKEYLMLNRLDIATIDYDSTRI